MVDVLTFEVAGYDYRKRPGKSPIFKVKFKHSEGHSLTLVASSREIYEGFPEGSRVTVKVGTAQKTLIPVFLEEPEEETKGEQ